MTVKAILQRWHEYARATMVSVGDVGEMLPEIARFLKENDPLMFGLSADEMAEYQAKSQRRNSRWWRRWWLKGRK